ncbi:protein PALS2 isoform X3 [Atheta coriaria]|uniref:protein PALS2 isoform X3 n=1 Tax=Dalotia coriaria TaxID=877792 RepID=UPI0031F39754
MISEKVANMVKFGSRKERQDKRELLASMKEMNCDDKHNDNAAFQHVRDNIDELDGTDGINETDLVFLKGLMDSPVFQNLVKVQDRLEEPPKLPEPLTSNCKELQHELIIRCNHLSRSRDVRELATLIKSPHFRALIDTHDQIAKVILGPKVSSPKVEDILPDLNGMTGETFRMVGLRRKPGEPLGLTVQVDDHENLVVARILEGGMIDKQGLLHAGDVILEVNNVSVYTPEDLQTEIAKSKDSVTLKIGQMQNEEEVVTHSPLIMANGNAKHGAAKKLTCYMRALFEYNPDEDTLLPCKEIGLHFERGDILQILDQKDPNWWQAKKVGTEGPVGLIPSIELEERRKAFVHPEADYVHKISICGARISKKKKKIIYQSKSNTDFDKAELSIYEEVTRMPPFKRKTLVLIGTQGVGRRTMKNRLINSDPNKFGAVIPWTTRPQRVLEENGVNYWFTDVETMDEEIKKHKFLEYGEYNNYLYGTHLDTMREIIKQGKMCVLDCSPTSLKILHNSTEFLPYVIFIAAPGMEHLKTLYDVGKNNSNLRNSSRNLAEEDLKKTLEDSASLQRTYDKYIDLVITNNDFDSTFRQIVDALDALSSEHQWVPVNWIY